MPSANPPDDETTATRKVASTAAPRATWPDTRVSARLGIRYPIIQGPLGGVPSERLTLAVSNRGGLGSFGAHGLEPQALTDLIARLRSRTAQPFAINLWVSMQDAGAQTSGKAEFERALAGVAPAIRELGGTLPSFQPYRARAFEAQARVLLDAKVPVFSFVYGVPPREILSECRQQGIALMGTATTPDEARVLEQAGVDVIVASGFEAGGHRGSFLRAPEDSLFGTASLVPQIVDAVSLPVVAAGGIADARGIVAALALGAEGVQMGTAFLACEESGAQAAHRAALLRGAPVRTALTRGFTGRLGRGLVNRALETANAVDASVLPYPLQRLLMRSVAVPAEQAGQSDLMPMWAGQSAGLLRHAKAAELLDELLASVRARLLDLTPHGDQPNGASAR